MKKGLIHILLAGAVLAFVGCDNQTKLTMEQIAEQTRKLTVLQENQAKQIAQLQAQLAELGPRLDNMNSAYFEKSYTDAFFFHTNTLYLLLAVDRQIESALKAVETKQQTEHDLAYFYHTNLLASLRDYQVETKAAFLDQTKQLATNIINDSHQIAAALAEQVQGLAPDEKELARRQQLVDDLLQIKADLAQIKARFAITNLPAAKP